MPDSVSAMRRMTKFRICRRAEWPSRIGTAFVRLTGAFRRASLLFALACLLPVQPAFASYESSCAGCHNADPGGGDEVTRLPNGSALSGSIKAANNLAYLNWMLDNDYMGAPAKPLNASQRQAIVDEIASRAGVYGPTFTNNNPISGQVGYNYYFQITTDARPSRPGSPAFGNHLYGLIGGSLPPGLSFDIDSGVISGEPTTGGTFSFTIRANNLIGIADRTFSIFITDPPQNDLFAMRNILRGGSDFGTSNNQFATKEAGEPNHAGNTGGKSVWWTWAATSTNPVNVYTCYQKFSGIGFYNATFDTTLAVYTGFAVNALTPVASNDDSSDCLFGTSSSVTFNATQGAVYQFAVDGYNGASGNIRLSLYQQQTLTAVLVNAVGAAGTVTSAPAGIDCPGAACTGSFAPNSMVTLTATAQPGSFFAGWQGGGCVGFAPDCTVTVTAATTVYAYFFSVANDNFADRIVMPPGAIVSYSFNFFATKEAGEPNHGGNAGGKSLWWTWTAPVNGSANITLYGSDFDTLLGVYTGNSFDTLTPVAQNNDFGIGNYSEVTFTATAGTSYHFAVDGVNGAFGRINFLIRQPGNNDFLTRLALTGGTVSVVDDNSTATKEAGEPNHAGNDGGKSLWWSWTAPVTGPVSVNTIGSGFDTLLGIYTGNAVNALTLIAQDDDSGGNANSALSFNATAGTTYQIAVDGYAAATGAIVLNILQQQPQSISFAALAARAFSPAPFAVSATASSGLPVAFSSNTPATCSVSGSNVTMLAVGTCTVAANQGGNASYFAANVVTQSFTISQGSQSITFGAQAAQSFANAGSFVLSPLATASSGLAVSYASTTPSVCTASGSTINMLAAGACLITASQPGNANYIAATPVSQVISINPGPQTISFPVQPAQPYAPGGAFMIAPLAVASSGLPITYGGTTPLVCTVSGGVVTIIATGTCTVTANQSGNGNFNPAPQVTQNITINPGLPGEPVIGVATGGDAQAAIAFTPAANTGGVPIANFTATCSATGQITRVASGTSSPITVTQLTNDIAYRCSVTATNGAMLTSLASAAVNVTPTATPVPPTITSANATTFTVLAAGTFTVTATGTPAPTLSLGGALPTGVSFTPGSGALAGTPATNQAGSYPLTLTATNASGTVMQSFTLMVQKAGQSISFGNPGAQAFTAAPQLLTATATSNLAVSFASQTTATCTVSGSSLTMVAPGSCTITASQPGNADYSAAAPVTQTFLIGAATQSITFPAQTTATRSYAAGASFAINPLATASSGLPVSYSSTTPAVCTVSGTSVSMVAAGTCTIAANQAGNGSYGAATPVSRSVTISGNVPGAPSITSATAGNTQATIAFTAPADNGGSAISLYTATCGAFSNTSPTVTPIVVSGLTNTTTYTCTVKATNATGQSAASTGVQVTPLSSSGATTWATTCAVSGCHGAPPPAPPFQLPLPPRFNAAGSTTTVMDFVFSTQAIMKQLPSVTGLTPTQRQELAAYLLSQSPGTTITTPFNTAANIDVSPNIVLNSATATFQSVEVVTAPASGTLSGGGFTGTTITYTPNNGFTGTDSFTYRGKNTSGTPFVGDAREVLITVQPPGPVITSALAASGTVGQPFAYQITATNLPTLYTATGLPGTLAFNASSGVISGTPTAAGVINVTLGATNATSSDSKQLVITVSAASQFISFPAQVVQTRPFAAGSTFPINPTAGGGASGNPVVYGSATTGVCTVSGTTVTIVAAGICTLTADQAGNANFAAAPTATQGVTITPVAPGAPTGIGATPGSGSAIISFAAPAFNGGSPVSFYTVLCNNGALPTNGSSSPITVTGLTIGLQYSCSVTATSAGGTSAPSVSVNVTPVAIAFTGPVESRKLHGATVYPITINPATPINGAIAIEPRTIGNGHQIAFTFNNPPTSLTGLTVLDANMQPVGNAVPSFAGNDLIITLTNVPDGKRVTITATGVNNALTVSASVGFLYGDVNGSGSVTATDIAYIKALSALPFNGAKFRADINASGTMTVSDVTAVKAQAGKTLP